MKWFPPTSSYVLGLSVGGIVGKSKKVFNVSDLPVFGTLLIIVVALGLFGADAPASSLTISFLMLAVTAVSLISFNDARLELWVVPFVALWAILIGVHYFTGRAADGEHEYLILLSGGCAFWMGRYGAVSRRRRQRLFNVLAVFAFAFSLFAFLQHMIAPDLVLGVEKAYQRHRLTGPFLSSNTTATFLGLLLVFLVYRMVRTAQSDAGDNRHASLPLPLRWIISKPITISGVLLVFTALLLTGSRAGFFATATALAILLIGMAFGSSDKSSKESASKSNSFAIMLPVVILAGISIWTLSGSLLETRLETLEGDFEARRAMVEASWRAGEWQPVLGHGLNALDYATAFTSTASDNRFIVAQNATHNLFAQWFMQAGWPGLLGLIGLIALVIYSGYASGRSKSLSALRLAFVTVVIAHGFFDYAVEIPAMFLFLCLLIGLTAQPPKKRRNS